MSLLVNWPPLTNDDTDSDEVTGFTKLTARSEMEDPGALITYSPQASDSTEHVLVPFLESTACD